MAWSLSDFEKGVFGVTLFTVVADEKKRREYLNRARLILKTIRNDRLRASSSVPSQRLSLPSGRWPRSADREVARDGHRQGPCATSS